MPEKGKGKKKAGQTPRARKIEKTFRIIGRVIDQAGRGVEGLKVEAWDKDLFFDDLIGSAETGSEGSFEMLFEESHFKEVFARRPDLYFKIIRQDELIPGAEFEIQVQLPTGETLKGPGDAIFWKLASGTTNVTINMQIPAASQLFKVHGRVLEPDGKPVVGATVKAFDKNIRTETLLGEAATDEAGRYEIAYLAEKFLQSGKKRPDLIVRAFDHEGEEIAFTEQPLYNARQIEEVNLVAGNLEYKGPSEYELLLDTLSPLLKDLELSELREEDVDFLSGKTGIASKQIVHLVLATRYSEKTDLPAEIFYGLFRQNFPTSLPALLAQNPDIQKRALEAAVSNNIIPETIPSEQVLERFQQLVVDHAFEPLEPLPSGKTTLGELLGTVQITPEQQREFLNLYVRRKGTTEEFWQGLRESDLQPFVQELQYTLQLGVLTGNHLALVQRIKQLESVFGLRDLAGLELDEWKGMIVTHGFPPDVPGKDDEEKVNNYARTIFRMMEDAFPTAVIAHKLGREEDFAMPFREEISDFLLGTPEFEFGSTQIGAYLKENPGTFSGVEEREALIRQLKTMDRLFRISPRFERYEAMKVLMENGFNSARSIAMIGQRSFSTLYAEKLGNYWKAKAVYTNAAQMTAMSLTVHAKYSYAFNQPGMYVLPDIAKKMQEIPDWPSLFGSFKLCDCKHCKSVLSPSAYLVDLLAFLRNHNLKEISQDGTYTIVNSALGVLSDRRPDIEHINISCENTNIPVPYVDLVNEILENAVSYNPVYYQTTGTADELGANPEYLNIHAYETLAKAIYPWSLPFDLWTEEVRTYLDHLGASRYHLMETFRKNGEAAEPDNLAIAGEYLDLTTLKRQIITDTVDPDRDPWEFWGYQLDTVEDPSNPDNTIPWYEALSRVPEFLQRSGLTYEELDELLNTRFINPGRFEPGAYQPEIEVSFEDAFCNVEVATITNLNAETLNKIHRFVRLVRKIGWIVRELDIALNILMTPHLDSSEIDEPFLLKLWHLHQLHSDLKIPIVNLLSFRSLISTDDYKGRITSLYDQLFLNKTVLNPEDVIFKLNDQKNELINPNEKISDHATGVQAALEMNEDDLSHLIRQESLFTIDLKQLNHALISEIQEALNDGVIADELKRQFKKHGILLSNANISVLDQGSKWLLIEHQTTYSIKKELSDLRVFILDLNELMFSASLSSELQESLNKSLIPKKLRELFKKHGVSLSTDADAWLMVENQKWLLTDHEDIYTLIVEEGAPEPSPVPVPDKLNIFQSSFQQLFSINYERELIGNLNNEVISDRLQNLFKENENSLSESARVSVESINHRWLITDHELKYIVKKEGGRLDIVFALEVPDTLNLSNLSHLYRIVTLSRALKLSIKEFLSVKKLTGLDPFDPPHPEMTLQFVDTVRKIRVSGFSIAELDYLLGHVYRESEGIAPTEKQIALILDEIRDGLQKIAAENAYVPDPTGEIIRSKLALLIPADKIEQAIQVINGTFLFSLPLRYHFDFENETISKSLRDEFAKNGIALSDKAKILTKEEERRWYIIDKEDEDKEIKCLIRRTEENFNVNADIPDDWYIFIDTYFAYFLDLEEAKSKLVSWESDVFIDKKEERIEYSLKSILNYLEQSQSEHFVTQKLAGVLSIDTSTSEQLLTRWVKSLKDSNSPCIAEFLDSEFVESEDLLTIDNFEQQFKIFILLQKIAMIITELKVETEEQPLLFQQNPDVWGGNGWLDLNDLPLSIMDDTSSLFRPWGKLVDLFKFRDGLLPEEPTLLEMLNSDLNDLLQALSKRTGWSLEDIQYLTERFGFTSDDYKQVAALVTLKACFEAIKRIGVSAEKICDWVKIPTTDDEAYQTARSIKQTAKAKYDNDRWLSVAKPLRDDLRKKQRSALVSYLVNKMGFENSNDLYAHFLIDPEMDPCMMTSRLKLATGTVQLFVQRCLMNLEEWKILNAITAQEWSSQWEWMKNYRVWEANRKVFLYPENWIEPELRDDKSPFFKDLENELLQNEVTSDHVEKVFLNYLEKLDAVARLEICGMYHEVEKEAPDGIGKNAIDTLHVFGRTRGIPHIYYYRQRIATNGKTTYWTPWERVDLDIEGDHLIPVVWNRRLYLFWPIFVEKAKKDTSSGGSEAEVLPGEDTAIPDIEDSDKEPVGHNQLLSLLFSKDVSVNEPKKYWEIKMAWSEYKHGKWSAKKISSEVIESSQKSEKVLFRTSIDNQNHLTIKLVDAMADPVLMKVFDLHGDLGQYESKLNNCQLSKELREEFASNGYFLPLQASVEVDARSKEWSILYDDHKYIIYASVNSWLEMSVYSDIYVYDAFLFEGCSPDPIINKVIFQLPLHAVTGTKWHWMFLREKDKSSGQLYLPIPPDTPVLVKTPGRFHLLFPHQYYRFISQDSFFYQDNTRTFFVASQGISVSGPLDQPDIYDPNTPEMEWSDLDGVQAEDIDRYLPDYFEIIQQYEHWEEILSHTTYIDPPIIETTFPAGAYDKTVIQAPDYGVYRRSTGAEVRRLARSETSSSMTESIAIAMAHASLATPVSKKTYLFETFYHPYLCEFVKHLNREGIDGLLQRPVQLLNPLLFTFEYEGELEASVLFWKEQFMAHGYTLSENVVISIEEQTVHDKGTGFSWILKKIIINDRGSIYSAIKIGSTINVYKDLFENTYLPTDIVDKPYPYEDVDFEPDGAYSLYNWEIFFHAPLLVADRLSENQRFAEAQKWFHYIFDPTDTSKYDVPQKYWKLRPFFETAGEEPPETLEDLLTKEKEELEKQVNAWRDNPFKPHLIARMRLMAYQKTVVMKYIDNLIAWGDQLFRRDTIESINEATQLYILAAEILGKRPEDIPPHTEPPVKTFSELKEEELDAFSNAMVENENYLSSPKSASSITSAVDMQMFGPSLYLCCPATAHDGQEDNDLLYFCIPKNQKLLSYWDTVADRLFKIRHCMTIEGVVRQLPLFEPPIDPGLLVRAIAAGVDIGSALNDLNAPLPHYRFQYMLQKAIELCADVRSLGASLLSALEKKDAEELALLRSGHEVQLLKVVRQIKKQRIDEAKESLDGLKKAKKVTENRHNYYKNIKRINANEKLQMDNLGVAQILNQVAQSINVGVAVAHAVPNFDIGIAGWAASPVVKASFGGNNLGSSLSATADTIRMIASQFSHEATMASIKGGYDRRWDDWKLQEKLANKELDQIDKQIVAAEIRLAIAENELKNHEKQIENAKEVDTYIRDKFTNQELYGWMVSQISTIYFQSYQMAYDIAKRAEKAFRQELGDFNASFVKFGYWDNLKKGLLSGEQLHYDLKRMETTYLDKNKREFELTKHISLAMLDPLAIVKLKETGQCFVNLPEALFDFDYPGHYMRRIKSVSLTIPCVTGPYTSVNCTLTLLKNEVRIDSSAAGDYPRNENGDDSRFRDNVGAIQSIATSNAQNDSGIFELNFRDERYLPFEGAGVISQWRIEMPRECNNFDFNTISDVILHMRCTARDGGVMLKEAAMEAVVDKFPKEGLVRMFSAKHEFPTEWHRFVTPAASGTIHVLELDINKERFPYLFREKEIEVTTAKLFLKLKEGLNDNQSFELPFELGFLNLEEDDTVICEGTFETANSLIIGVPYACCENLNKILEREKWYIKVEEHEKLEVVEDILIVFEYSLSFS